MTRKTILYKSFEFIIFGFLIFAFIHDCFYIPLYHSSAYYNAPIIYKVTDSIGSFPIENGDSIIIYKHKAMKR